MNAILPRRALSGMLADIAAAAATPLADRDRQVAAAIAPHVADPELLRGIACPCGADRYTRHLLHENREAGYAVVAIVWRPGQMSPVHGHRTWCGLGVHRGVLTETFFRIPESATAPVPAACVQRRAGDISHAPADPGAIHRIANLGVEDAVSIHCYGVGYDSFGDGVNHVWAV